MWETLTTKASPVWPDRVRPLRSTMVPEICAPRGRGGRVEGHASRFEALLDWITQITQLAEKEKWSHVPQMAAHFTHAWTAIQEIMN